MTETILLWGFLMAAACSSLFVLGMLENMWRQWLASRRFKKSEKSPAVRAFRPPYDYPINFANQYRGYDSPEIFWEDSMTRVKRSKRKLDTISKKSDLIV